MLRFYSFKNLLWFDLRNNNWLQLLLFSTLFDVYYNNCSIDLYNWDLQATIILFTYNVSSHKTDWILSELPLLYLAFYWKRISLLMRNLYKCKQVVYVSVFEYFVYLCPCRVVVACLLAYQLFCTPLLFLLVYIFVPFFTLMLLLYFCLLVDHVIESIVSTLRNKMILLTMCILSGFVKNNMATFFSLGGHFITILYPTMYLKLYRYPQWQMIE